MQQDTALVEETNAAIEQTEAQASELDRVVAIFILGGEQPTAASVRRAPVRSQEKTKAAARAYLTQGNAALKDDWSEH